MVRNTFNEILYVAVVPFIFTIPYSVVEIISECSTMRSPLQFKLLVVPSFIIKRQWENHNYPIMIRVILTSSYLLTQKKIKLKCTCKKGILFM